MLRNAVRVIAVAQRIPIRTPFTEFASLGLRPGTVVWRTDLFDAALFILPEPLIEIGCPCLTLLIFCGGAAKDGKGSTYTKGDDSDSQMPAHITGASCQAG
jgi:hypothetical protein